MTVPRPGEEKETPLKSGQGGKKGVSNSGRRFRDNDDLRLPMQKESEKTVGKTKRRK